MSEVKCFKVKGEEGIEVCGGGDYRRWKLGMI
jgi:hypothetical protein